MNRVKFEFQEILAFITIMILIFGANGLNFLKLNKMVTQEEFRDLKCQFIKLQKISAEKEKEQLLIIQGKSLSEPFQLQYI